MSDYHYSLLPLLPAWSLSAEAEKGQRRDQPGSSHPVITPAHTSAGTEGREEIHGKNDADREIRDAFSLLL